MDKVNLKSLDMDELVIFMDEHDESAFRAKQLIHWMYEKRAGSLDDITVFSKDLRQKLSEVAYIPAFNLANVVTDDDGTEKYLLALNDGLSVECVLIPDENRQTLCVSSQVGCAIGCSFCKTGTMGISRSLEAHEIVDQLLVVSERIEPKIITNIVFMGMGEPFNNLDEVSKSISVMTGVLAMAPRRITVSTCGIVPGILEFPSKIPAVNLAISLNAASNTVRDSIMPINKRYPIEEVIDACKQLPLKKGKRITFEYVLLKGINDSLNEASKLVKLLKGLNSMVNLIPFNPYEGSSYEAPSAETVMEFQSVLTGAGILAFTRKSKGNKVMAACGQLWSDAS